MRNVILSSLHRSVPHVIVFVGPQKQCGKQATLSYLREHMSTSKQPKEREKLITVETRETGIEAIFEKMTK